MTTVAQTATLAWGYTMAEVDSMAWQAVRIHPSQIISTDDAAAAAWHGIVEALYAQADEAPRRYDLVAAGLAALHHEHQRTMQMHGISSRGGQARNFVKYWNDRNVGADFTERIAEKLALPAVLGELTPLLYETISTLAAFDGDKQATAQALGVNRLTLENRITRARRQLLALWFDHETPRARGRGDTDKCINGHSRAEHGFRRKNGDMACRTCQVAAQRRFRTRARNGTA